MTNVFEMILPAVITYLIVIVAVSAAKDYFDLKHNTK